jgi:hypothetical protein
VMIARDNSFTVKSCSSHLHEVSGPGRVMERYPTLILIDVVFLFFILFASCEIPNV